MLRIFRIFNRFFLKKRANVATFFRFPKSDKDKIGKSAYLNSTSTWVFGTVSPALTLIFLITPVMGEVMMLFIFIA